MGFLTKKERYGIIMNDKEYIVLQYPLERLDVQTVYEIFHNVQEGFPEYKVVAIPECIQWFEMSREELIQVRGILDWILEKKNNDTNSETRTGTEDSNREV